MPSVAASGGLDTPRRTGSGGRRPIASRSGENDSRPSERRGHADGGYAGGTKTPRPYGGAHRGGGNSGGWWERSSSSLPPKMPRAAANEAIQRADAESLLRWVRSHGASVISLDGLKDGVALCEVIQRHDTGVPFTGLNRRAKSRAAVLANLELALQATWKKSPPTKLMPTAERILDEDGPTALLGLLLAMVEVFAVRVLCKHERDANTWFEAVTRAYGIEAPPCLRAPPSIGGSHEALWADAEGCEKLGVALFCVAHSCSPGNARPVPDPARVFVAPEGGEEARVNLDYSLECLETVGVPSILCGGDATAPPMRLMVLAQAHAVWSRLSKRHGQHAGGASCCAAALRFADHPRLLAREEALMAELEEAKDKEHSRRWRRNARMAREAAMHAAKGRSDEETFDESYHEAGSYEEEGGCERGGGAMPGAWI